MVGIIRELTFATRESLDFLEITHDLQEDLGKVGMKDGEGIFFIPHTTAGLTINENADPDVIHDLKLALKRIAPDLPGYRHLEGNSSAHLLASLMGSSLTVPVREGRLALGTWQGIYLCEFDGPRRRKLLIRWRAS